jgi:hypothetical protein
MAELKNWYDYTGEVTSGTAAGTHMYGSQGDGLRFNNMFIRGNKAEMDKVWEFFKQEGRLPTEQEFKTVLGGGGGYKNIMYDMNNTVLPGAGINPMDVQPGAGGVNGNTYFDEMTRMDDPNTVAGGMYDTFKRAGDIQYEEGMKNLNVAQRDLGMNQAMDRQKFLDQIRNRRRMALKTGLSSAQIANQEVQSLLMAQGQSNENARSYYDQVAAFKTNHAMNDVNARQGVYETLGGGMGSNLGAVMAAGAGDANQVALNYAKNSSRNANYADWWSKAVPTE